MMLFIQQSCEIDYLVLLTFYLEYSVVISEKAHNSVILSHKEHTICALV